MNGKQLILVVDGDDAFRKFMVRVLSRNGYQILEAADGNLGFDLFSAYRGLVQLVITAVELPGMNGPSLVGKIQAMAPAPIIYVTGGRTLGLPNGGRLTMARDVDAFIRSLPSLSARDELEPLITRDVQCGAIVLFKPFHAQMLSIVVRDMLVKSHTH